MDVHRRHVLVAAVLSVALHVTVGVLAIGGWPARPLLAPPPPPDQVLFMEVLAQPPVAQSPPPPPPKEEATPVAEAHTAAVQPPSMAAPDSDRAANKPPATLAAPPAPTAEEWAFAARYTNKNSKGYRHSWGQQVRSMMGTAVEGPDQGVVRFRVEIAPDGTLARLDTLWSTSAVAEQLARKAVESMPPLPPTPTGKPLVFEKTISFTPYANDGPPVYRDDCLPDPPAFRNRFAWQGGSQPSIPDEPEQTEPMDPQALAECLRQLPKDSVEAEAAHDQRLFEQWRSHKLGK